MLGHCQACELQAPPQHRQVGIQTLGGQRGAACRAGHAHDPLDLQAFGLRLARERLHVTKMLFVLGIREKRFFFRSQQPAPAGACQHLGNQAAARMREQVQPGASGQRAHQRQGIGDRALAHGGVVQRIDAARVALEQLAYCLRMQFPQLAEGADGIDEGAVHQHQEGPAIGSCRHRVSLEATAFQGLGQRIGREFIHTGLDRAIDLLRDGCRGKACRLVLEQPGDDFKGAEHGLAQPAARRAPARGGFEPRPAQLRRDGDFVAGARCHGAARAATSLRAQQVPRVFGVQHQRRAVGDRQHHHVFAGNGRDTHDVAAAALRANANRRLQRTVGRRGSVLGRLLLARNGEGDGLRGGCHGMLLVF